MADILDRIRNNLCELQDMGYKDFSAALNPAVDKESVIGVRTPALKKLAKEIKRDPYVSDFLSDLPHKYFEENNLHAFIIADIKNYDELIAELGRFLPFVDNWATCDQLRPVLFKKEQDRLISDIRRWIESDKVYTVRFGIEMLMCHFLEEKYSSEYPKLVSEIKSDEYYLKMMIAWYFATALAKQYDDVLPYIENRILDKWTHNKTIQKALESYRISEEYKKYLKTLKY